MRFYSLFMILIGLISGPNSDAKIAIQNEWSDQMLEGGGGASDSVRNCRGRLSMYITVCQNKGNDVKAGGSQTDAGCVGHPNAAYCTAEQCMKDAGYRLAFNTDPAEHCRVSIPYVHRDPEKTDDLDDDGFEPPPPKPIKKLAIREEKPPVPVPRPERRQDPAKKKPDPAPTADWKQESAQDIQSCSGDHSQASLCCNQPMKCSQQLSQGQQGSLEQLAQDARNRNDSAGLREICAKSRQATADNSNVNTGFANVCYSKHSMCSQTCAGNLKKWQDRLNSCGANCDRALVSETVNSLYSKDSQCKSFASLESKIRAQSFASADTSNMSELCRDNLDTAADEPKKQNDQAQNRDDDEEEDDSSEGGGGGGPSLSGLPGMNSKGTPQNDVKASLCDQNPYAPGCNQIPMPTTGDAGGGYTQDTSVSQAEGLEINPDKFNVGVSNNFEVQNPNGMQVASVDAKMIGAAAVIPNGGGGMNGGSPANPQAGGEDLPSMLGDGKNPSTDILKGESGGGGYVAQNAANTGSGFDNRYQPIAFGANARPVNAAANKVGLDLKNFLPGADQDPRNRGIASVNYKYADIGAKHVDFFFRVSGRFQELCKLNRLYKCK